MIFIKVKDSPDSQEDSIEIPVETEGFILKSTLTSMFPGSCGLKFKTDEGSWRSVRVLNNNFYPAGDKWNDKITYVANFPKGIYFLLN